MTAGDVTTIVTNNSWKPALVCDGIDDYGEVNAATVALVASNSTTGAIMAWVKPLSHAQTGCIFSSGNNGAAEYLHLSLEAGHIHTEMAIAGVQFDVTSTAAMDFSDNKWHHVAVVQNGTNPVLYFDGIAVAMTNNTATQLSAWYDELTGGDHGAIGVLDMNGTQTLDWDGGISGVKIYNEIALSADEVKAEYESGDARNAPNLIDSRKLDLAAAVHNHWVCDDLTDDGSGADNMTLTGNAVNHLFYSDLTQKMNNAYTHANDIVNVIHDNGSYVVTIVHGA